MVFSNNNISDFSISQTVIRTKNILKLCVNLINLPLGPFFAKVVYMLIGKELFYLFEHKVLLFIIVGFCLVGIFGFAILAMNAFLFELIDKISHERNSREIRQAKLKRLLK
jgi:hypothetical protein